MSYSDLQHLSATEFKRLCGVSRDTFAEMVEVLRPHLERSCQRGGQNKLSAEDQHNRDVGVLAGIPQPISYRDKLGGARDHRGTDC
jgi:hypothetical protein